MAGRRLGMSRNAVIAGIGATEFSKDSGRSELQLAAEAVLAGLADAGLTPDDVDGLVTFVSDTNPEIEVARTLGMGELTFFSRINYGGGAAAATIQQAQLAIANGIADVVVCYRAFNERSADRFGLGTGNRPLTTGANMAAYSWVNPFGLLTPAQNIAIFAQRYMHEFGATSEDFGRVAVLDRKHAATNPKAWFYGHPITLEEHQASRWIAEPLHLLDCCQESDGAQAIVVVAEDRIPDLPNKPVHLLAAAQGAAADQHSMTSYYRPDITGIPELGLVARQLYAQSGLTADDIDASILYDHFTPMVLMQLEELGFCGRGEAAAFIAEGNLELDGRLPTNTHGGQLGEAYIHGMNGIAEGVRLVRGTSANQPEKATDRVLVTAGTAVPTSGIIIASER
jgi:acetyl-CoA acetyltransferase